MCAHGPLRAQVGEKHAMKNAMIRFILNAAVKKTPFKSIDIVKQCLNNEQKWFANLLPEVEEALVDVSTFRFHFISLIEFWKQIISIAFEQVYGLTIHEIKDKTGKIYLITSEFGCESVDECSDRQREETRLLFIVLAYIFMKGGQVIEQALFGFLRKLQLDEDHDEYFGFYKKKITKTFIKQHYLKKEKIEMESGNVEERWVWTECDPMVSLIE